MDKKLLKEIATSSVIVAFIGIAITGLMLMADIKSVNEIHENLGIFLLVAVLSHVYVNFNAFKNYLKNKIFILIFIIMIIFVILSVVFPEQ